MGGEELGCGFQERRAGGAGLIGQDLRERQPGVVIDGDVDVDVLSAARTGDELVWWENDGTSTTFTKRLIATPACAPRPLPFCSRGRGE